MGDLILARCFRVRDGSGSALGKCSTDTGFSVVPCWSWSRMVDQRNDLRWLRLAPI